MTVTRYEPAEGDRSWIALMAPAIELAKAIANTDFVPVNYRGKTAEVAACVMYGDEVGLGPLQSLAKIAVINGRPTLAAEAQRALIQAAGHEIWVEDATTTRVTMGGRRKDSDRSQLVTWSMDDAKRAGLAGKQPWRTYPRQMLLARASAELARAVFADVIGGLAATEEIDDTGEPGEPPPPSAPEPPAPSSKRKRATKAKPRTTIAPPVSEPEAPPEPPLPGEGPEGETPPKASDAQLRKLFALLREQGLEDRDDRLDWANKHLDRTILSASELTDVEASTLIDALDQQASPPETLTKPTGEEQLVTQDRAEILQWMRREAEVSDAWMRTVLTELGVKDPPEKITRQTLQKLTQAQGVKLAGELNLAIDARRVQEEG